MYTTMMSAQPVGTSFNTMGMGTRTMAAPTTIGANTVAAPMTMGMSMQQGRVLSSAAPRAVVSSPVAAAAPMMMSAARPMSTVLSSPVAAAAPMMMSAARPVSGYVQPVAVRSGTSSAELLAAGTVRSTRTISIEELVATGRMDPGSGFAAPLVFEQAAYQENNPALDVAEAWNYVHQELMGGEANARVPRDIFVQYCLNTVPNVPKLSEYEAFVNILFDTAVSLMLPAQKNDLGKHCFGYAAILSREFYFEQGDVADVLSFKADDKPMDSLATVRTELDADWEVVDKDADGRVNKDAFMVHFLNKHAAQLVPESQQSFETFLAHNFNSSLAMMLPDQKTSLGGHCFRYAGMMAGEFYFDAANQASAGCGCSAPVRDILGITH